MPNMHRARKKIAYDNIEKKADRLSNLSDDLIHKILSFISIKDTVKIMTLSSRYRFIWTTMPYLNFETNDFPRLQNFVDYFLKRRNNQIDVSSLTLYFRWEGFTKPSIEKLVDYAFSHNIQRLELRISPFDKKLYLIEFPLSLFSNSQSLTYLSLSNESPINGLKLIATSILELPGLTTLYLEGITLDRDDKNNRVIGFLSKCTNLKNLTLKSCKEDYRSSSLSICHPELSNLTLYDIRELSINVVAPQLENLTIRYCDYRYAKGEYVISAPKLASLAYRGQLPLKLSTDGFHSLKEADIRVLAYHLDVDDARQMVGLLQQLHNVKFLKLNLEIIELLSESVKLISHQPSPFVNLESLTIYPENLETYSRPKGKVNLSTQLVKNYLLDSSPGASVTKVSREEIIAERDFASAQKKMAELRVLLEQEKANIKTYDRANTNRSGKAPIDKGDVNAKMQLQICLNRESIKSCWEDLMMQLKQRKATACCIISMLDRIKRLLKKLPATKRAMMQARFSSLCAEADTVMCKLMKLQGDEHQSRITACFHQL